MVGLGIAMSLGLIAVSAALNFRIGYRAADQHWDGLIYGGGAAMSDVIKAILPFAIAAGIRNRDLLAVVCGTVAFILMSAYSLTAGIGFAAEQKVFQESGRSSAIKDRKSLERRQTELDEAARVLGFQRSEAEVAQAIAALLKAPFGRTTLGAATHDCAETIKAARERCKAVADLETERERARAWANLERERSTIREALLLLGPEGEASTSDPQAAALSGLASWSDQTLNPEDVRIALAVLVSLVFELGSGLGLYLVTTPWREPLKTRSRSVLKPKPNPNSTHATSVQEFLLEGLEEVKGQWLSEHVLLSAYQGWCRKRKVPALGADGLRAGLTILASEAGMPISHRNGQLELGDVGLRVEAL